MIIPKYFRKLNDNVAMKKLNLSFISLLILFSLLQGCMPDSLTKFKKDEPKKATDTTQSVGETSTTPPDLTTLGVFQLRNITQKDTSYHLHKYGAGNKTAACEIPTNQLTNGNQVLVDDQSDILCWLEAEEMQLFFNGADFQINVPPGFCEYIQVKPYYYWNDQPKNTFKTVENVVCAESNASCASVGGPQDADLRCEGDYTLAGGPNCDEGTITLYSINVTADVPENPDTPAIEFKNGLISQIRTTIKCGGKRTNCYGGPGKDFAVNTGGFPIPIDYLAYTGQSVNYSVTSPGPLGKNYGGNQYISNYTQTFTNGVYEYDYTKINTFTGMDSYSKFIPASASRFVTSASYNDIGDSSFAVNNGVVATSTAITDIALDPLKGTSSGYRVQPFYEFSCLNFSHEVKGRIRLQIREWNKKFESPSVSSDVEEGSSANLVKQSLDEDDYETSGIDYWNDVSNWDTPFAFSGPNNTAGECQTYTAINAPVVRNYSECYAPYKLDSTTATGKTEYGFLFPRFGY